jgi:hypothetical protein
MGKCLLDRLFSRCLEIAEELLRDCSGLGQVAHAA